MNMYIKNNPYKILSKKNNFNFFIINILVIILLIYSLNLPLNIYTVAKHNYQERLISIYGFCEKKSYGFMKEINEKYGKKYNINSFNFDDYPKSSSAFFYKVDHDFNFNQIIVLNYNPKDSKKRQYFKKNYSKYKILENYNNKCFFLEKN